MQLDYQSSIPLHVQVENVLRDEVLKGVYSEQIPSERELMERFSISRSTVRQAVSALVKEGILEKRHGRGTFVSHRPVEQWLGNLRSYDEIITGMGMKPSIKLLYKGYASSPTEAAHTLGLDEFYEIDRLRFADDTPIVLEKAYYPKDLGLQLAKFDLNNVSIYDVLESSLGVNLWEADQIITSGKPSKEEAQLLEIPESICIMKTDRYLKDSNGNPIEYENSIFRSDMYGFRIKLTRKRG
ncbi:MAG: GntR family transcriptional regulator [Firmicutes bacterium]|nr:GntR family transcriptional regulator [Bacillota bacterium]